MLAASSAFFNEFWAARFGSPFGVYPSTINAAFAASINCWAVMLPEPPHRKLAAFAETLLAKGVKVLGKDLRGLDMPEGVERTQG